jgi:hypothetical protein
VNYERAWLRLKERMLQRRSHGTAQLAELMAEIEVECEVPEDEEVYSDLPARPARSRDDAREGRALEMATH